MAYDFSGVLEAISSEHGIAAFKDRKRFVTILQEHNDQSHTKEIRLLQKLSYLGYISGIVKKNNTEENIEILSRQLHEDECIDLTVAREVTKTLFSVINEAREQERLQVEEAIKHIKEAEEREQINIAQKKSETLEKLLTSLLKTYRIDILDNPDFCRAWLKDIAMGDFVDEITVLTLLLEAKVQQNILKYRLFKQTRENLIKELEQKFRTAHESSLTPVFIEHSNLVLTVFVNILENMKDEIKQKEGGMFKWPKVLSNFLRK